MPINNLGRNLNLCFSKIKWPLAPESPPLSPTSSLNTPDHDHHNPTLPSSSTLIKNFNSLYDNTFDSTSISHSHTSSSLSTSSSSFEPDPTAAAAAATADLASAFASHRFFFSSPGLSNSIIESSSTNTTQQQQQQQKGEKVFNNSVAVPTYSPDPYADFRRSMQEMVEARELVDVKSNWDFLHELLLCYLALNPKSTHKFIVGAFADLLASLMSHPPVEGRRRDPNSAISICEISQP